MDTDYLHDKLHQDTPQTSYHRLAYKYYATPVRTRVDIRKAWNIPEDAALLLSIGELRPNKRFRIVLQAMARLREKYDLHYILCGTGSDLDFLQKLTRRLHLQDRVHFVGYRTDIPDFLGAADIFCYPAKQGNDCITVQEAAAAGLPIISARCPGMKWYAERELFEPISLKGDMVDTCAAAITKLIEDKLLQKQIGAVNRAQAKKFDRDDNKQEESYEILRRNHYFPTVEHIKAN